ncbi:hypothetical protein [Streptomyces sp. XD-27]|uniref:hypothetical protein n=1 Tax=Streptomyces sp. XD-27 TaxID=3062779 RepID=UPI0026F41F75|nr:hypothetical protein [Streptomyces sp. XD-27]WKX72402.1 hypothetical protein Q3Y56_23090 [Streptomyces sp. XD-27]
MDSQKGAQSPPFQLGDRVRGMSYVAPDRLRWERPEPFEGVVVQIGSGWAGVDADHAYVWSRLDDHTEHKSLVTETELVQRAETEERHDGPRHHQGR